MTALPGMRPVARHASDRDCANTSTRPDGVIRHSGAVPPRQGFGRGPSDVVRKAALP